MLLWERKNVNLKIFHSLGFWLFCSSCEAQAVAQFSQVLHGSFSELWMRSQIFALGRAQASASLLVAGRGGKGVSSSKGISLSVGVPTKGSLSQWAGKLSLSVSPPSAESPQHGSQNRGDHFPILQQFPDKILIRKLRKGHRDVILALEWYMAQHLIWNTASPSNTKNWEKRMCWIRSQMLSFAPDVRVWQ